MGLTSRIVRRPHCHSVPPAVALTLLLVAARAAAATATSSATLAGFQWEGLSGLSRQELERATLLKPGDRLDEGAGTGAVQAVTVYYRNQGFLDVAVSSRATAAPGGALLTLSVVEGDRYSLGTVRFRGLRRVSSMLAFRESGLLIGKPYDPRAVFRAQTNLYRTRLFEDIVAQVSTTTSNTVDVEFVLEERRSLWLRAGVGYGSEERQRVTLSGTHHNFLGRGYKLEAVTSLSGIWLEHRVDFVNRYFFGTRTEQAMRVLWRREDRQGYDSEEVRGRLGFSRALGWDWTGSTFYRLKRTVTYNIDREIALTTPDETVVGTVGVGLARDTSDDHFFPRSGTRSGATLERTGGFFGGNVHFLKASWDGAFYRRLWGPFVGAISGRFGAMRPTGSTRAIPIYDRFFTGGANSVRGYRERGVGPTDSLGAPLGGGFLAGARLETRVPLFWRLTGAAFIDGGQVGDQTRLVRPGLWKSGAGGGLRVRTPVGPLRADVAYKVNPDPGDRDFWRVHLSVGEAF